MKSNDDKAEEEQKEEGTVSYHTYLDFYFGGKAKLLSTLSIVFLVLMVVGSLS